MMIRRLAAAAVVAVAIVLAACGGSSGSSLGPPPPATSLITAAQAALAGASSVTVSGELNVTTGSTVTLTMLTLQMSQDGTLGTVTVNNNTDAGVALHQGQLYVLARDVFTDVSATAGERAGSNWVSIPEDSQLPPQLAVLPDVISLHALARTIFTDSSGARVTGHTMVGNRPVWTVVSGTTSYRIAADSTGQLLSVTGPKGTLTLDGYGGPVGLATPGSSISLASVEASPTPTPSPPPATATPAPTVTATPSPTPTPSGSPSASPSVSSSASSSPSSTG